MGNRRDTKPRATVRGHRQGKDASTKVERPLGQAKWEWNIETQEYHWSEQMYQIFQMTPPASPPRMSTFLNHVHPDDRQRVVKALGKALVGAEPYNLQHRILWADGSVRLVHGEAKVWFDEGGRPIRMSGTLQNV